MRVLFDHQAFWMQNYGGISRTFVELIERLRASGVEATISLWYSDNEHLRRASLAEGSMPAPTAWPLARMLKRRANIDVVEFMDRRRSVRALKRGKWDLFHPTYYYPYFLEHLDGRPFVVTVHDMIHEAFPDMFKPFDPTSANKRSLTERADRIIAISESTKKDIVRFFDISPNKVDVVHHGPTLDPRLAVPRPGWLPTRYVLFVGNRHTYKNFERFAPAISKVMKEEPGLHLVCAGGKPFREYETAMLGELGILERTIYTDVDDPLLACLYRHAEAFIFPSLYEGFGLPLIEAMACGCPVIASNTSSFPEVAGDAAVLFDPADEDDMSSTMLDVLRDADLRARMAERGLQRVGQFSWERTARMTREVYERLI